MIAPSINMTFGGAPMEKLGELIEKRRRWLHETYKDSVVATAITALQSVRKATRTFKGKISAGGVYSVVRQDGVHTSFDGKSHRRCIRAGRFPRKGAPRLDLGRHVVQLVPPSAAMWRQASVYKVELSPSRAARWTAQPVVFYVVAPSESTVREHLDRRYSRIAARSGGAARSVLGAAMGKLSTRPPASEKAGERVDKLVRLHSVVIRSDSGDEFTVYVRDDLAWAVDAVQGGWSGVQNALKSAANRIAGMIRHRAGARLDEDLSTPFPEVKRK